MNEHKNNMPAVKLGGHKLKNDLVFIAILLAVVIALGAAFWLLRTDGDSVRVTVGGELLGVYPLSKDLVLDIVSGEDGEGHNLLVIKDGRARVTAASCPDGICASHRPISKSGESIVCLPNRVVITVTTEGGEDAPDVVV